MCYLIELLKNEALISSIQVFKILPARCVDVLVQSSLDFIIGQEGHVAGVRYCQEVPVPQD